MADANANNDAIRDAVVAGLVAAENQRHQDEPAVFALTPSRANDTFLNYKDKKDIAVFETNRKTLAHEYNGKPEDLKMFIKDLKARAKLAA